MEFWSYGISYRQVNCGRQFKPRRLAWQNKKYLYTVQFDHRCFLSEDLKHGNISTLLCLRKGLAEVALKGGKEVQARSTAVSAGPWSLAIRQKK